MTYLNLQLIKKTVVIVTIDGFTYAFHYYVFSDTKIMA
jgi:hypothetical protein